MGRGRFSGSDTVLSHSVLMVLLPICFGSMCGSRVVPWIRVGWQAGVTT